MMLLSYVIRFLVNTQKCGATTVLKKMRCNFERLKKRFDLFVIWCCGCALLFSLLLCFFFALISSTLCCACCCCCVVAALLLCIAAVHCCAFALCAMLSTFQLGNRRPWRPRCHSRLSLAYPITTEWAWAWAFTKGKPHQVPRKRRSFWTRRT